MDQRISRGNASRKSFRDSQRYGILPPHRYEYLNSPRSDNTSVHKALIRGHASLTLTRKNYFLSLFVTLENLPDQRAKKVTISRVGNLLYRSGEKDMPGEPTILTHWEKNPLEYLRYRLPPPSKNSCPPSTDQNGLQREAVTYEELTAMANSVFGEGRWSHSITSQAVDFVEYVMGKYQVGCAAFVRVQLADGTFHEAMGYSTTESSVKGSAIQTARSLSIALALKKALLCFGGIIAEKVIESVCKTKRKRQDGERAQEERLGERTVKMHQAAQENTTGESKTKEHVIPCVEEKPSTRAASRSNTCVTPMRNKSPKPLEPNDEAPIGGAAEAAPAEADGIASHCGGANDKDPNAASMTDEEIRLERKRKQKQKQEEYKKLMKEKLLRVDEKPNPRF